MLKNKNLRLKNMEVIIIDVIEYSFITINNHIYTFFVSVNSLLLFYTLIISLITRWHEFCVNLVSYGDSFIIKEAAIFMFR